MYWRWRIWELRAIYMERVEWWVIDSEADVYEEMKHVKIVTLKDKPDQRMCCPPGTI